jgi:AbrB family looped-hinge helix DNA binding protein
MKAILSEKGQITIPKGCRDKLGLRPGAVLDFEATQGKLVGRKVQPDDALQRWRGKGRIPGGLSVDDYLARVRAPRP